MSVSNRSEREGYVKVRDRLGGPRGFLRLTQTGWRYFAPEEAARKEPIGDPLRCFILTAEEIALYFGSDAQWDDFEVTL